MANQVFYNYCLPLANGCYPGQILINYDNGDAEWFANNQPYPTFKSSQNTGGDEQWGWTPAGADSLRNLWANDPPVPGALDLKSAYANPDALRKDFYLNGKSIKGLNNERGAAFTNNAPQTGVALGVPNAVNVDSTSSEIDLETSTQTTTSSGASAALPGALKFQKAGSFGNYQYPTGVTENNQDYIRFQMIEYGGLTKVGQREFGLNNDGTIRILGTVCLPIQPSITDISSVDWQNDTLNPLQAMGAESSLDLIRGRFGQGNVDSIFGALTSDEVKKYVEEWAAGKAVGSNIFSRFSGAVVNPNLELLFNGPQLRPFNFNFRLSPRSDDEAKQIKNIIRFFKKGMAVRKTKQEMFLKAPNVFRISYINGQTKNDHNSINRIKVCALSQCGVDYTPEGSYATFFDDEAPMTQYGLTLQFNEIEPVFSDDYDSLPEGSIGY